MSARFSIKLTNFYPWLAFLTLTRAFVQSLPPVMAAANFLFINIVSSNILPCHNTMSSNIMLKLFPTMTSCSSCVQPPIEQQRQRILDASMVCLFPMLLLFLFSFAFLTSLFLLKSLSFFLLRHYTILKFYDNYVSLFYGVYLG